MMPMSLKKSLFSSSFFSEFCTSQPAYGTKKKHFKDIMPQKDYQKILSEINRGIGFRYSRNYEIPQTKINETYITFKFDNIIFTITYEELTPFSRFMNTILF